jgi:hypothetical protein
MTSLTTGQQILIHNQPYTVRRTANQAHSFGVGDRHDRSSPTGALAMDWPGSVIYLCQNGYPGEDLGEIVFAVSQRGRQVAAYPYDCQEVADGSKAT